MTGDRPVVDRGPGGLMPALRVAAVVTLCAAVVGLVVPPPLATWAAAVAVGVVVAAPLCRVALLTVHWARSARSDRRDLRFVGAGVALLGIAGVGALLALVG